MKVELHEEIYKEYEAVLVVTSCSRPCKRELIKSSTPITFKGKVKRAHLRDSSLLSEFLKNKN